MRLRLCAVGGSQVKLKGRCDLVTLVSLKGPNCLLKMLQEAGYSLSHYEHDCASLKREK